MENENITKQDRFVWALYKLGGKATNKEIQNLTGFNTKQESMANNSLNRRKLVFKSVVFVNKECIRNYTLNPTQMHRVQKILDKINRIEGENYGIS